ncbi:NlpC/P60 family protein [Nonomuraea sp. NPDC050680]|uniref:bifunctional WXG100 family type VII secretion target/C40 family peptidase n=1 Tax=Nonomuraea sp. NPDC050680 TaxID=3154630 RepID=UPI0033E52C46
MELGDLPGGDGLANILKSVSGDPGSVRGVAKRWRGAGGKTGEYVGRLGTAVKGVNTAWQGDSADAFDKYMRRYSTAGGALHDALTDSATTLDDVAQALETAASKVRGICGDVLDKARAYKTNNPDATQAEFDKALSAPVADAVEDAKTHLTSVNKVVKQAVKTIGEHWNGREATFAAIKAPGDQTFVPAPGHTVHWDPTPLPEWQKTTLASADGNGNAYSPASASAPVAASSGPGGSSGSGGSGGSGGAVAQAVPYVPGGGTGADIVNAARQHLGKPYVWGANGPSAFDCSGLIYYSLNQAGIKIGDTTAAGYQASGHPISGPPQAGDIVFFGAPPDHVGIYIGDGKMIHAPHPGANVRVGEVAVQHGPITYRRF